MSTVYRGSCLCGEVRFEITGEFESFYLCHCAYCRKDTGSAHAANLFSTTASLHWLKGEDLIRVYQLPGTRHARSFCSQCGSALPQRQMAGQLLVVPAGSLDGPLSMQPDAHLFVASKADWDDALEKRPQFAKLPD